MDPTQRTIDILRASHSKSPIRISTNIVININENGVGFQILKEFLKKTVDEIVNPLLEYDSDDRIGLQQLWVDFEHRGSVVRSRRAREEVALARVSGYTECDITEEVQDEDDDAQMLEDVTEHSVEWWPDEVSGCPSSLEETIISFLDSGFHPSNCEILREKIYRVVETTINRVIENCHIEIPLSASAWIIPGESSCVSESTSPAQIMYHTRSYGYFRAESTLLQEFTVQPDHCEWCRIGYHYGRCSHY